MERRKSGRFGCLKMCFVEMFGRWGVEVSLWRFLRHLQWKMKRKEECQGWWVFVQDANDTRWAQTCDQWLVYEEMWKMTLLHFPNVSDSISQFLCLRIPPLFSFEYIPIMLLLEQIFTFCAHPGNSNKEYNVNFAQSWSQVSVAIIDTGQIHTSIQWQSNQT